MLLIRRLLRCLEVLLLLLLSVVCQEGLAKTKVIVGQSHAKQDDSCFTQGLEIHDGFIFESCGQYGQSLLRKVRQEDGKVMASTSIARNLFAEGLTIVGSRVFLLTWQEKQLLVFDTNSLALLVTTSFTTYSGEGWGLAFDGKLLIASDGSDRLTFLSVPPPGSTSTSPPQKQRELIVKDKLTGNLIKHINELEYVEGYIYANIWYRDHIIKIDPVTGYVLERIDLRSLYPKNVRTSRADCLNGIAYNASSKSFLLTGKLWPSYFSVTFEPPPSQASELRA